jgi:hypothetical protein
MGVDVLELKGDFRYDFEFFIFELFFGGDCVGYPVIIGKN